MLVSFLPSGTITVGVLLRGLVRSRHLAEVDGSLSEGMLEDATTRTSFGSGIVVPSHEYYCNETSTPFDVLDEKEIFARGVKMLLLEVIVVVRKRLN